MIQMRHELQDAFFRAMFIGVNSPYLQRIGVLTKVEIRRDFIVRDTLFQLDGKSKHDLKKQLRITFFGEEGIDEGGVQKGITQLIQNFSSWLRIKYLSHQMVKVFNDRNVCDV
jgi:hypothetical protein